MSYIRSYARDGAYLAIADGVGRGAVLGLFLFAARVFGPITYGELSVVVAVALALSSISDLGISQWLIREIVAGRADVNGRQEGQAFSLSVGLSIATVAGALLVSRAVLHSDRAEWLTVGAAAYAASLGMGNMLYARERSERRLARLLLGSAVEKVGLVVIGLWAVRSHSLPLLGAAYLSAAVTRLLYAILTNWESWRRIRRFLSARPRTLWPTIRGAWPFSVNELVLLNLGRLDILFVAALAGSIAAAYFGVGDKLVALALSGSAILTITTMPILGRLAKGNQREMRKAGLRIAGTVFGVSGAAVVATIIFVPGLGLAKLSASYAAASIPVSVMLIAVPFSYAAGILMPVAYMRGREYWIMVCSGVATVSGTAVLVIGTRSGGALGAGLGYSIRQVILCSGYLLVVSSPIRTPLNTDHSGVDASPIFPTSEVLGDSVVP